MTICFLLAALCRRWREEKAINPNVHMRKNEQWKKDPDHVFVASNVLRSELAQQQLRRQDTSMHTTLL